MDGERHGDGGRPDATGSRPYEGDGEQRRGLEAAPTTADGEGDGEERRGCPPGTNRGGGPKTPEGRERALANLRTDTNLTHGVYSFLNSGTWPKCATCPAAETCPMASEAVTCAIAQVVYCDEMEAMLEVPHIRNLPVAKALMRNRARAVAMMERCMVIMSATDFFVRSDETGQVDGVPLLAEWKSLGNMVISLSKELLITPKDSAQQQLSLEMASGMDEVRAVVRELRGSIGSQEKEPALEGEFEYEEPV